MAFDFGMRRVGIAVGQTASCTATAVGTVRAKQGIPDWEDIDRLIRDWEPDFLVIGSPSVLPESGFSSRFREFGARLADRYNLPLYWISEELTTEAAIRELSTSGISTAKKKSARDQVAARLILESWFHQEIDTRNKPGTRDE